MQTQTVLWIILAFLVALGIAIFHYWNYKSPLRRKIILTGLRFLTLFAALVLFIGPEFVDYSYRTEKPNLILLVDGTSSIADTGEPREVETLVHGLLTNQALKDRFSLEPYRFSKGVRPLDSLTFDGKSTDINNALKTVKQTFASEKSAVVLISDGNQTFGKDYEYQNLGSGFVLNALVVGDTVSYRDVAVGQINSNKYAFLDNEFPVEVQLRYSGKSSARTTAVISMDGQVVHREQLDFNGLKKSHTITTLLKARSTGIKTIAVQVQKLENEKNTANNRKTVTIDVIDEKTRVGIVSSFMHPDLGCLKKSIESNEQREVVLLGPNADQKDLEAVDVIILYQPDASFGRVFDYVVKRGMGYFTITGDETDWNFLNDRIDGFSFNSFGQSEEVLPVKNNTFGPFTISDTKMEGLPPLKGALGELVFEKSPQVIAYQKIKGINLEEPLFFVFEGETKQAFLLGEDIWKWRLHTHKENQSFEGFDALMGKLIFFLASSGKRERLQLSYENVYRTASNAQIKAAFFDKSYTFQEDAELHISLTGKNGFTKEVPLLFSGQQYEADLSDLEEGDYAFTVKETKEGISRSGNFRILDFDLEKQFASANFKKLERLSTANGGALYYPDKYGELVDSLLMDEQWTPIQKGIKNVVSLIDFRVVLGIIALSLALEWFIRKYNGLV